MSINVPQGVIDNILTRLAALEQSSAGSSPAEELTPNYLQINPNGGIGLDSRYLATADDLSDVPDPTTALENLGVLPLTSLGIGPLASWYLSTTGFYTNAGWTPLPTDTINYDPDSLLTNDGTEIYYTVPADGIYLATAAMNYNAQPKTGVVGNQQFNIGIGWGQYTGVGTGNLLTVGGAMSSVLGPVGSSPPGPVGQQGLVDIQFMAQSASDTIVPMILAQAPTASQLLGAFGALLTWAQIFRLS